MDMVVDSSWGGPLHVHTICTQPCTDARGDGGRASRIQGTTEYVTRVAVDMHADCSQPCTDASTRGDLAQTSMPT